MVSEDEISNFLRLLYQAIPDRHRDKAEIVQLPRLLVGSNEYVEEMSDPIVLLAMHLYRKSHPEHEQTHVPLPVLIHFLRTRLGLQQVDALERRLAKIRGMLFSMGAIDVTQMVQVSPLDILAMRVLASIEPPWDAGLPDATWPQENEHSSLEADPDTGAQ